MLRVINFFFDTSLKALKLKPIKNPQCELKVISDSEFAGDRDTQISVYGYVTYYYGAPISWKSKAGKSVTLSSTEAEYYASSEAAKELVFVKNLVESIGIKFSTECRLMVDNTGAIYLANNYTTGRRTKHIDIRAHFVREKIVEEVFKVNFIKSAENDADIMTKNVGEDLFVLHSNKLLEDLLEQLLIHIT